MERPTRILPSIATVGITVLRGLHYTSSEALLKFYEYLTGFVSSMLEEQSGPIRTTIRTRPNRNCILRGETPAPINAIDRDGHDAVQDMTRFRNDVNGIDPCEYPISDTAAPFERIRIGPRMNRNILPMMLCTDNGCRVLSDTN